MSRVFSSSVLKVHTFPPHSSQINRVCRNNLIKFLPFLSTSSSFANKTFCTSSSISFMSSPPLHEEKERKFNLNFSFRRFSRSALNSINTEEEYIESRGEGGVHTATQVEVKGENEDIQKEVGEEEMNLTGGVEDLECGVSTQAEEEEAKFQDEKTQTEEGENNAQEECMQSSQNTEGVDVDNQEYVIQNNDDEVPPNLFNNSAYAARRGGEKGGETVSSSTEGGGEEGLSGGDAGEIGGGGGGGGEGGEGDMFSPPPSSFSGGGGEDGSRNNKHEDQSLEGRYATALFRVTKRKNALEKVYSDLETLRKFLKESKEFCLFVETPGIFAAEKINVMKHICKKCKFDGITNNFINVVIENGRFGKLPKIIDSFENFYRGEKGEIKCLVTSGQGLSVSQQREVVAALQKRAGEHAKLIVNFNTSHTLMGGLIVRMGEQVFDFSVNSRLERLQAQLLAPLN